MATTFPCPNPACKHVFAAADLKGVEKLTCPGCGSVFRLKPKQPAAPSAAPPAPVVPAEPTAAPGAKRRAQERRRRLITLGVFVGLGVALLAAGVYWIPDLLKDWEAHGYVPGAMRDERRRQSGPSQEFAALNFRFTLPSGEWQTDQSNAREDLHAVFVLRRSEPDAWLAVIARDYKTRTPRDDEVREDGVRRLERYFRDNLETEAGEEVRLAGHPAQRMVFRGQIDGTTLSGESYQFAHQGIAYWVMTWAPAASIQEARDEFDDLRGRLALVQEHRPGWTDRPALRTFRGHKVNFTIKDEDGRWNEEAPATDFDPAADLALRVTEQIELASGDRKTQEAAKAVLLVLKGQTDLDAASKAAQVHVEEQLKSLGLPTEMTKLPDEGGAKEEVGTARGKTVRYRVQLGSQQRFVLLAVVREPARVLAWHCECDGKRQADWEPRFRRLLNTFQLLGD